MGQALRESRGLQGTEEDPDDRDPHRKVGVSCASDSRDARRAAVYFTNTIFRVAVSPFASSLRK